MYNYIADLTGCLQQFVIYAPHLCEYSFAAEAISNSLIVLQVIRLNFSLWINYSEEVKKQAEHVISTNEKTLLTSLNYTTYKLIDEIIVTL